MPRHYPSLEYDEFVVVETVYHRHDDRDQYYDDDLIYDGESTTDQ